MVRERHALIKMRRFLWKMLFPSIPVPKGAGTPSGLKHPSDKNADMTRRIGPGTHLNGGCLTRIASVHHSAIH